MDTMLDVLQVYRQVRKKTEDLCQPLTADDYAICSVEDVSTPKWHLAHTTWFFERFVLSDYLEGYVFFHPLFQPLFDSYHETQGNPYPNIRRGVLPHPTVETIYKYRQYVDGHLEALFASLDEKAFETLKSVMLLGLNHERQHQEYLLMDIKHNLSCDAHYPAYRAKVIDIPTNEINSLQFDYVAGGQIEIGYNEMNFCFDNELPAHHVILKPYQMAKRLITNAEYCEFIDAGGYRNADYWSVNGWECLQKYQWQTPLYWQKIHKQFYVFTLSGLRVMNPSEPVSHISYHEAYAYARWRGCRLPTEAEWEHYTASQQDLPVSGNFLESNTFHPLPVEMIDTQHPQQLFGDLWEWTTSVHQPYPGYRPSRSAIGEFNENFRSNQFVMRGGCCATPQSLVRTTYRNYYIPDKRWQFSGIRLAMDVAE